ncbi:MAG TPA: isoprenylcysteine carboxylmethyltransferase family protein [Nitrospira sp.]|nr:isoprenylcysteine carboxylmethyltransferase family protein [Nitrospira sp.]
MENLSQADKRSALGQFVYRQRAVVGNVIVFGGFLVIWFDPYAGITIGRLLSGLMIGGLGFALRIWASSYQWHNISRPLPQARTGLITAGPYSLMRHPIYLSMLLLTVGIFLAFGSWLAALVVVPPTIVLNYWQARYEDAFLFERYGAEALEYKKQVPIFLPKFWKPYPIRNGSFSLSQGLKFDIGPLSAFICFGLAMLIVVMRRAPTFPIILIVLVGSVAFSFFLTWLVRSVFKQEFAE